MLCALINGSFVYELSSPNWTAIGKGFVPIGRGQDSHRRSELVRRNGSFGGTVMPHNLYLCSSIIQKGAYPRTDPRKWLAVKYGSADSTMSLLIAFL